MIGRESVLRFLHIIEDTYPKLRPPAASWWNWVILMAKNAAINDIGSFEYQYNILYRGCSSGKLTNTIVTIVKTIRVFPCLSVSIVIVSESLFSCSISLVISTDCVVSVSMFFVILTDSSVCFRTDRASNTLLCFSFRSTRKSSWEG